MPIELICLDADDTLWHNMRHFDVAERAVIDLVAPFADAGVARAAMDRCEMRNLALYGYGAKSFTLSMIETAVELCGDPLPEGMLTRLLAVGRTLLAHPVELLDEVEATLETLAARAPLVLVTKGDLLHQEAKLAASGLGDRFAGIEIVSDKTPATFARIFDRFGVAADRAVMAGDSMRSDIHPALGAGAWAAFIPQPLAWSHEQVAPPVDHPRFMRLTTLAELPGWIERIG